MSSQSKKKQKLDENLFSFNLPTHSPLLTKPFKYANSKFKTYFHKIEPAPLFGFLSSLKYPSTSLLSYIEPVYLTYTQISNLKLFQQELWTDLFKSSKKDFGSQSPANYFIIPLKSFQIDWSAIKKAIKQEPLNKISDYTISERQRLVLKTGYKSNATWKYLQEINHNSQSTDFLVALMGSKHPSLLDVSNKYKGFEPIDILIDERFKIQSAASFRELVRSGICKNFNEKTVLVFAKQTKSIKHQPPPCPKKKEDFRENGTPILISDITYVFYLDVEQWDQGRTLLNTLIEIENQSYLLELAKLFEYQGDFEVLKEASQSPGYSGECNYESLETLGDTVLKCVYTLHIYLNNLELNEFGLTRQRGWKVSNKHLSQIANSFELKRFLKTKAIKTNSFRPAYYLSKDMPNESYEVEQKMSESMLADFVEALIGAFFLSSGILAAGNFLLRLGIISQDGWELTSMYLNNENLAILSKSDLENFPEGSFKFSDLLKACPKSTSISVFGYEFESVSILKQALTHKTLNPGFNYERLEFLGDAIIDVIILSNIWTVQKFEPEYLTYFKHELVSNNTLAKISISTDLHQFMKIDDEIKELIEKNWKQSKWDEDIYNDNDVIIDMPKCLGDIFESVVAGILIDSGSLWMTCTVIGYVLCNIILYIVKNKDRYKKRIIARLCEKVAKQGKKIEFKDSKKKGVYCVKVYIDNQFIYQDIGSSLKNAKDNACQEVFRLVTQNLIN